MLNNSSDNASVMLTNNYTNKCSNITHSSEDINTNKYNTKTPIPRTVWQIGIMMFLMNLSYVIAYSFSGLYLKHILGTATFSIAILEGLCETEKRNEKERN